MNSIESITLKNQTVQLNFLIEGKIVGRLRMEQIKEPAMHIPYIHVNKGTKKAGFYRDRGIGTRLLLQAIEIAKDREQSAVSLFVWSGNEGAIRFYARLGFFIAMSKMNIKGSKYYLMTRLI